MISENSVSERGIDSFKLPFEALIQLIRTNQALYDFDMFDLFDELGHPIVAYIFYLYWLIVHHLAPFLSIICLQVVDFRLLQS